MELTKSIDLKSFQLWFAEFGHFYEERDMEEFGQMMEDYLKYKENEGKEEG